ncbi:glutaredoxin 3 [Marichromatium bheemlicum]|uniref:Glutaredoxin n=1 Tax=Marichromatium bheemlicum TaxID=365339 RepID=A0ABX1IBR8_9GAMM|nr:glutaredoxin 3 [Marichromatium bheemlicum]NKN34469.1 glutaredoxin 3 [Marichromatium bheemlicum]
MPQVTLYTTRICPYCIRARRLLERKGVAYEEIDINADPAQRSAMIERSGRHTVPQIFIDEHHIGGYDDMAELDVCGELDPLLHL